MSLKLSGAALQQRLLSSKLLAPLSCHHLLSVIKYQLIWVLKCSYWDVTGSYTGVLQGPAGMLQEPRGCYSCIPNKIASNWLQQFSGIARFPFKRQRRCGAPPSWLPTRFPILLPNWHILHRPIGFIICLLFRMSVHTVQNGFDFHHCMSLAKLIHAHVPCNSSYDMPSGEENCSHCIALVWILIFCVQIKEVRVPILWPNRHLLPLAKCFVICPKSTHSPICSHWFGYWVSLYKCSCITQV